MDLVVRPFVRLLAATGARGLTRVGCQLIREIRVAERSTSEAAAAAWGSCSAAAALAGRRACALALFRASGGAGLESRAEGEQQQQEQHHRGGEGDRRNQGRRACGVCDNSSHWRRAFWSAHRASRTAPALRRRRVRVQAASAMPLDRMILASPPHRSRARC
jgi:hypothetical protein